MSARWRRQARADLQITSVLAVAIIFGVGAGFLGGRMTAPPQVVEIRTTVTHAVPPVCLAALDAGDIVMEKWDQVDIHDNLATDWAAKNTAATYGRQQDQADEFAKEAANEVALRNSAEAERNTARDAWNGSVPLCESHNAPTSVTERIAR